MKKDKVTVRVVPDVRRKKGEGKFPLKLRLTYKGDRRYYGTGFDASDEDWAAIIGSMPKGDLRRVRAEIVEIEKKPEDCADKILPFSFKEFEKAFFDKGIRFESLRSAFEAQIEQLEADDRWGTASSYRTACNALYRYKTKISLEDVDVDFLQKFEKWILKEGMSITTVGIYLRALRTIINLGARDLNLSSIRFLKLILIKTPIWELNLWIRVLCAAGCGCQLSRRNRFSRLLSVMLN